MGAEAFKNLLTSINTRKEENGYMVEVYKARIEELERRAAGNDKEECRAG